MNKFQARLQLQRFNHAWSEKLCSLKSSEKYIKPKTRANKGNRSIKALKSWRGGSWIIGYESLCNPLRAIQIFSNSGIAIGLQIKAPVIHWINLRRLKGNKVDGKVFVQEVMSTALFPIYRTTQLLPLVLLLPYHFSMDRGSTKKLSNFFRWDQTLCNRWFLNEDPQKDSRTRIISEDTLMLKLVG